MGDDELSHYIHVASGADVGMSEAEQSSRQTSTDVSLHPFSHPGGNDIPHSTFVQNQKTPILSVRLKYTTVSANDAGSFITVPMSRNSIASSEEHQSLRQQDGRGGGGKAVTGMPGQSNDGRIKDPIYYHGEEIILYPTAETVPPTDPLLRVNHQIRAEMQETIKRKPIHWRIRLSFRDDKELLYPTWISMPASTNRIGTLDVEIRIRKKKTASLFSTTSSIASANGDNSYERYKGEKDEGDLFFGTFALLQRLLERGPAFMNKKRAANASTAPITIGCLTLHLFPKDLELYREPKEIFEEYVGWADQVLTDKDDSYFSNPDRLEDWQRNDKFVNFFAERIDLFAFEIEGMRQEWILKDMMVERDERTTQREDRDQVEYLERLQRGQEEAMRINQD